jgi:hypothetical protein
MDFAVPHFEIPRKLNGGSAEMVNKRCCGVALTPVIPMVYHDFPQHL